MRGVETVQAVPDADRLRVEFSSQFHALCSFWLQNRHRVAGSHVDQAKVASHPQLFAEPWGRLIEARHELPIRNFEVKR